MLENLVRILDRNRIFEFRSLESIVVGPAATFDVQHRFMAADPHPHAAFQIGRQIALPIMFASPELLMPGVRLDNIFVFVFLRHNSLANLM